MNSKQQIRIPLAFFDVYIEITSFLIICFHWWYASIIYEASPNLIPIPSIVSGKIDVYWSRDSLYELPIIATILYIVLSIADFSPHLFNYLIKVTSKNASTQYKDAGIGLRVLKISILIVLISITFSTTHFSKNSGNYFQYTLIAASVILLITPTVHYILKSVKKT